MNTYEGWREVKVVSVSDVEELAHPATDGTRVALVNHRLRAEAPSASSGRALKVEGYRAGFWEAKEFGDEQWAEAQSRGAEGARRVTSVNDSYAPDFEGWYCYVIQLPFK